MRRIITASLLTLILIFAFSAPAYANGQNGTTLAANVDITGHWTLTYGWTIDKSVTPNTWNLFAGDSGTSQYTIAVTKDKGTQAAWFEGFISVNNGGEVATEGLAITVALTNPNGSIIYNTAAVDVSSNPVLDPGETGAYPYIITLPSPAAGATYKVTAHVTITNHSGHLDKPFGPSPSNTTVLAASPTLINDSINVDDSNGGSWSFNNSGSATYEKTFTNASIYYNTANIRETGQSDTATVTVNVYQLQVSKSAKPRFNRTYQWAIDKSADYSSLLLTLGQVSPAVTYTVIVKNTGYVDSNFNVTGTITVNNPAPIAAVINSVADILPAGVAGTVEITNVVYPYTIPAGGQLSLDYSIALPQAVNFTNTAEVTLQNYNYSPNGKTAGGTTPFSAVAPVNFGTASINEVDETVSVSDTYYGNLGNVSVSNGSKTFNYTRVFGPYNTYGIYNEVNTASFITNDTGLIGNDSWTVTINVPKTGGTLTFGYWKTHSEFGPAPYDDTWAKLPSGAKTTFFLSGKTYYQVLWTPPAGDAYYQLAHQYIAAKLNILNGTSAPSEVTAAIAQAEKLFNTYKPGDIGKNQTLKKQFTDLASLLDKYNSGIIGPGHASE